MTIRVGAVSYLNTKPLIYRLDERLPACDLHLDLPSRLADQLGRGELDVALIPSVEFLRQNAVTIVTDACIACRGPVRSVQLLFRKPPHEVRTLALDEGSRTSAILAQVLLARRFDRRPSLLPLRIDCDFRAVQADAVLVIGDRAMQIDAQDYTETWDLGEHWMRETGLPFVFAMWVAAAGGLPSSIADALQAARDDGLAHLESIIQREAPRYDLSPEDCRRYFMEQLHFSLGPRELAGLDLFRQLAVEHQLLPEACKQLSLEPI
jgi:chorismate dehydratase